MIINDHPTKLTETDAFCVRAFAECGMKLYTAAKMTNYSRSTIRYHLLKVRNMTGLNPLNQSDLAALLSYLDEADKA